MGESERKRLTKYRLVGIIQTKKTNEVSKHYVRGELNGDRTRMSYWKEQISCEAAGREVFVFHVAADVDCGDGLCLQAANILDCGF